MVCPGGQKGTTTPADGIFPARLGLVGAVAIPPKYKIQAVPYITPSKTIVNQSLAFSFR